MSPQPSIFDKLAALDALASEAGEPDAQKRTASRDKAAAPAAVFDKLAALDALAESAAAPHVQTRAPTPDRLTALPTDGARKPVREPEPRAPAAAVTADPVVAMLNELKRDIAQIKHDQATPHVTREDQRLFGMLAELRRDIDTLKHHEAEQVLPPGEKHLYGLLADLRRDIEAMRRHEAGHDLAPGERQLYGMLAELRRDIETMRHHEVAHPASAGDQQLYGMLAELRRDIEVLKHHEVAAPVTPGEQQLRGLLGELRRDIEALKHHDAPPPATPAEQELFGMLSDLKRDIRNLQGHAAEPAGNGISRIWQWFGSQSMLSTVLVSVLAAGALAYVASEAGRRFLGPAPVPAVQLPAVAAPTPPRRGSETVATNAPVFDALAAGGVSPKGVNAAGMSSSEILARINAERQAGRGRLGAEGEFWMKRYLIASLGDNNTARALTQLGTIYAEGGGSADYGKARHLWEVAGGLGDPVAMCFLGTLYDNGLGGVSADRQAALQWYARARDAGGCAGVAGLPGGAP